MNAMTDEKEYDKKFITIEQLEDALEERQLPDRRKEEKAKNDELIKELREKDRRKNSDH